MHTVYCRTCQTTLTTYILGRGYIKGYSKPNAVERQQWHLRTRPGHEVVITKGGTK